MSESAAHRADFRRNEQRIYDAAARVLADDPTAGMADIAAAAGLGRATLYRHFATREALIATVHRVANEAAADVMARHTAPDDERSAVDCLRGIVEDLIDVGDRYRFVLAHPGGRAARDDRHRRFEARLAALVARAQDAGELDPHADPLWVLISFGGLIEAAARSMSHGRISPRDAKLLVMRGLLDGFGAPPA